MDDSSISIPVFEATQLGIDALQANGITSADAGLITQVYMAAEMADRPSHGLRLIPWILNQYKNTISSREGKDEKIMG